VQGSGTQAVAWDQSQPLAEQEAHPFQILEQIKKNVH
jgi:hypothetical protein